MFTMQSDSGMKKSNHANFQNLPDTRYNPNEGRKNQKDKNRVISLTAVTYMCSSTN